MLRLQINYGAVLSLSNQEQPLDLSKWLGAKLSFLWCDTYIRMPGSTNSITIVNQDPYTYLFDEGAGRVVAMYGVSEKTTAEYSRNRMRGFMRDMKDEFGNKITKGVRFSGRSHMGHLASHAQGGLTDINLFPQRRDVNLAISDDGKAYTAMETYCRMHEGTFCFSRLFYNNDEWVPASFEYGILAHGQFRVKQFSNAAGPV